MTTTAAAGGGSDANNDDDDDERRQQVAAHWRAVAENTRAVAACGAAQVRSWCTGPQCMRPGAPLRRQCR